MNIGRLIIGGDRRCCEVIGIYSLGSALVLKETLTKAGQKIDLSQLVRGVYVVRASGQSLRLIVN